MIKVIVFIIIVLFNIVSYPLHKAENEIDKISAENYDGGPASDEYQLLGQEAQNILMPKELHVPVKKLSPEWESFQNYLAIVELDGIYCNEIKLNNWSYGIKRHALFHEAVHVKYKESLKSGLVKANEERRADIEGSYATGCFICVQDAANLRSVMADHLKENIKTKGYLLSEELQKIVDELKSKNKVCLYHKKFLNAETN